MSLWLSIRLPLLPLEALLCDQPDEPMAASLQNPAESTASGLRKNKATTQPVAVIENNQIVCVNPVAYHHGVRPEQSVSSALTLSESLRLLNRHPEQEQQYLQNLALSLYVVSPAIQLLPPPLYIPPKCGHQQAFLVLEIGRSLKLYQNFDLLIEKVKELLAEYAVQYDLGIANTPKAARLLAWQSLNIRDFIEQPDTDKASLNLQRINKTIDQLTISLLEIDYQVIEKIHSVGIWHIGKLRSFPMRDLIKRFGKTLYCHLQQLSGELSDPIDYFLPAETFYQKREFIDVIHHRQGLLFPARYLIGQLLRFLQLKQKSCQALYWEIVDTEKNTIGFEVLVSACQQTEQVYLELTRLNLERYQLHAPVEAMALTAKHLIDLNSHTESLLAQSAGFKEDDYFIQRIRAKLGPQSCWQIATRDTHVPELASACHYQINTDVTAEDFDTLQVEESLTASYQTAALSLDISQQPNRPAWLMEKPKPIRFNQHKLLWQGELQIISSQENISHYWWKKQIARDYFLAEHEDGTIYWVFYDRIKKQWFLHGVYS